MSASDRVPRRSDAMPTTRGAHVFLADPDLDALAAVAGRP
jgi:hypothetical protein